jgi:hypothetical protein
MTIDTTNPWANAGITDQNVQYAAQHAVSNSTIGSSMTAGIQLGTTKPFKKSKNFVVFKGTIEIMQVANGFVMNVATKEGYEYDTYVASTIQEVNERLAATIVSFKLEQP